MPKQVDAPSEKELSACLGSAGPVWTAIVRVVEATTVPIDQEWRPSKTDFGRMCLFRHGKRTLLYLTPDADRIWVAIVLGERAYGLVAGSSLPADLRRLFDEARPYAEGRGIRFSVSSPAEIPTIAELIRIKTAPR